MFSKYCIRSRPFENGYITPTPAPPFLSCSTHGSRMVVINGHDDNYLDSLRIPCFVLPQIWYQWTSKPHQKTLTTKNTLDLQKVEWHLACFGDRPWLAPGPSLLWGSEVGVGSWGQLTPGVTWLTWAQSQEPCHTPSPVVLRGALATACMEEEQAWATWDFKVRNCQSTCLGSCYESDSGDSQGAPQGWRVLAGLALAQVDDVIRVFCDNF